jgi:WD40 repeat protein
VALSAKPGVEVREGYSLRLVRLFGSRGFKPTESLDLLGWTADEQGFRVLRSVPWPSVMVEERDVFSGELIRAFTATQRYAWAGFGLGANGALVVSTDGTVSLWNLDRGERVGELRADERAVARVAASADGRTVTVQSGAIVSVYALPARGLVVRVPGRDPLAVSPDGERLLAKAPSRNRLYVYRRDGVLAASLRPPGFAVVDAAVFSLDGRAVVATVRDGSVICWDVATRKQRWLVEGLHQGWAAVARSPVGEAYYTHGLDDRVCALSAAGAVRWQAPPAGGRPWRGYVGRYAPVPSPSGALVAVARMGRIRLLDAVTGRERSSVDGHEGAVTCVAISADGGVVASGGADGVVRVHEVGTGETAWTLEADGAVPNALEFLPDRAALRGCGSDGVLRRWDLTTGFEDDRRSFAPEELRGTRAAPEGSHTLVRTSGRVELWSDLRSERVAWSLATGIRPAGAACFCPVSGAVLVARCLSSDGTRWVVEAHDRESGRLVGESTAPRGPLAYLGATVDGAVSVVNSADAVVTEEWGERRERRLPGATNLSHVEVSRDGRWLVGREGALVRLWRLGDAPTRAATVRVADFDDVATDVAISADGTTLAIGTQRGCVLVYAIAEAPVRTGSR